MAKPQTGRIEPVASSILSDPWPAFLDWLDTNPDKAWEEFYVLAKRLVRLRAPVVFRSLGEEDQADLLEDVLQDLQDDNFRQLRSYRNLGRPFAVWFWRVLRNRTLDHMKYTRRREHEDLADLLESLEDLGATPELRAELRELLTHVEAALDHLSPQCQLLLKAAAEGYTPRELQTLLGLGAGENKKLSDQLRYCRRKLTDELAQAGITVEIDP